MPRLVLAAAVAAAVAGGGAAASADPGALYDGDIVFDVYRDGEPVGRHRTTFEPGADGLRIRAEFDVRITFLGFEAYTFTYASRALWRDGDLHRIAVSIDDDGEETAIFGEATADGFRVRGPEGSDLAPASILPTNHWNVRQVEQRRLLNTLTGTIDAITVTRLGTETVETGSGPRRATRYRYDGGFLAESWYDAAGRWVKLRFAGTDGSTIDYVCRRCGPDANVSERRKK